MVPQGKASEDLDKVRAAQQLTGEILWVSQRTRPSYSTCIMASLCTRRPEQSIEIGAKTLSYLQRTIDHGLGARSHGGWVVTYGGTPIAWRSSRQNMVTLSTAESELLALLDGVVAMKSVESILGCWRTRGAEKISWTYKYHNPT